MGGDRSFLSIFDWLYPSYPLRIAALIDFPLPKTIQERLNIFLKIFKVKMLESNNKLTLTLYYQIVTIANDESKAGELFNFAQKY